MDDNRERERALYLYSAALERGDFEKVAEIMAEAETDPELLRKLTEIDTALTAPNVPRKVTANRSGFSRIAGNVFAYAPFMVLIAVGVIAILTLMGPAVGNVFSSTIMSMPQEGFGSNSNSPRIAALPTGTPGAAVAEVTALGGPNLQLSTPTPAGTFAPGTQSTGGQLPADRMIIRNGELDLTVENTDTAIDQVSQVAADNGGYVLSTQADTFNGVKNATITIGVQAAQFDIAMRRIRQIALEVRREVSTGQDVTGEFVDLESRLRNLEATADRIRELLGQAATVQEALVINQQLSDVEAQIEQVKGRMNFLGGRSAYSTITIRIDQKVDQTPTPTPTFTPTPTATFTPTPTPVWSLGPTFERAAETQSGFVRGVLEILTWVTVVFGPYIAMALLALWGLDWLRKRTRQP